MLLVKILLVLVVIFYAKNKADKNFNIKYIKRGSIISKNEIKSNKKFKPRIVVSFQKRNLLRSIKFY